MKIEISKAVTLDQVRDQVNCALAKNATKDMDMDAVWDDATIHGDRIYLPIRWKTRPRTRFEFVYAISGAEVELRDEGIDIELVPEYRQAYIVVAHVHGEPEPFMFESEEGREYDDLATLTGHKVIPGKEINIEGYPFDNPAEKEIALREAQAEYPNAKLVA